MSRRTLPTLLAALLPATGCLTPPPPARWEGDGLTVRAEREERAREVGHQAAEQLAWIRANVPGLSDEEPEIWLVDRIAPFRGFPLDEETVGLTFRFLCWRRIYVREGGYPGTVSHELGHFLIDDAWDPLPPFLEEGLCDWIAVHGATAQGTESQERRARLRGLAALGLGGTVDVHAADGRSTSLSFSAQVLDLDAVWRIGERGMLHGSHERRMIGFCYGLVLFERGIQRFGWDGWLELCGRARESGRARLSIDAVLAALGLEDVEHLGREHLRDLEPADLEEVAAFLFAARPDLLVELSGALDGPRDWPGVIDWLDHGGIEVRVPDGGARVRLADVPEVLEALAGHVAPASAAPDAAAGGRRP